MIKTARLPVSFIFTTTAYISLRILQIVLSMVFRSTRYINWNGQDDDSIVLLHRLPPGLENVGLCRNFGEDGFKSSCTVRTNIFFSEILHPYLHSTEFTVDHGTYIRWCLRHKGSQLRSVIWSVLGICLDLEQSKILFRKILVMCFELRSNISTIQYIMYALKI